MRDQETPYADFEAKEQEEGYFAKQAASEFKSIVERERRKQRVGKLAFLRSIGRKGRLDLSTKYGKRWQEALK